MRMAARGEFTAAQIATQVGCSRRQFFNWVKALKAGGVAGLLQREHKGGAKPRVAGKLLEEFQAGLQEGRWKRAMEIQHWLRSEHQVKLALTGVYYWLGKCGGVLKVPRKAHAKQDPVEAAQFQQQLADTLRNLNVPGGRPVRLRVSQEQRYGLIP